MCEAVIPNMNIENSDISSAHQETCEEFTEGTFRLVRVPGKAVDGWWMWTAEPTRVARIVGLY